MKNWLKAQHLENEDHGIRSHHFMGNRWRNSGDRKSTRLNSSHRHTSRMPSSASERDGHTRPPDLPLEKPICRSVRTGHGTTDWFQIGKGVRQGCILSPCVFNLYAEYIMQNARLDAAQAGIKIAGRNINNLDMQMTPPLWQKVKRN